VSDDRLPLFGWGIIFGLLAILAHLLGDQRSSRAAFGIATFCVALSALGRVTGGEWL